MSWLGVLAFFILVWFALRAWVESRQQDAWTRVYLAEVDRQRADDCE